VNTLEIRLFDAIDGSRRIGEIVADVLPADAAPVENGRRFFERLWIHDHIAIGVAQLARNPGSEQRYGGTSS